MHFSISIIYYDKDSEVERAIRVSALVLIGPEVMRVVSETPSLIVVVCISRLLLRLHC